MRIYLSEILHALEEIPCTATDSLIAFLDRVSNGRHHNKCSRWAQKWIALFVEPVCHHGYTSRDHCCCTTDKNSAVSNDFTPFLKRLFDSHLLAQLVDLERKLDHSALRFIVLICPLDSGKPLCYRESAMLLELQEPKHSI